MFRSFSKFQTWSGKMAHCKQLCVSVNRPGERFTTMMTVMNMAGGTRKNASRACAKPGAWEKPLSLQKCCLHASMTSHYYEPCHSKFEGPRMTANCEGKFSAENTYRVVACPYLVRPLQLGRHVRSVFRQLKEQGVEGSGDGLVDDAHRPAKPPRDKLQKRVMNST